MISLLTISGIVSLVILFFWVFSSSLGIPGGAITIIAYGSLSGDLPSLGLVILVSFIAAVIGDIFAYGLARKFSETFIKRLRTFRFFRDNEFKSRGLLNKNVFWIIFLTRFLISDLCAIVSYICGLEKINRKKFISAVLAGEFLFAVIYSVIGFIAGEVLNSLLKAMSYVVLAIVLILALIYIIRYLLKRKNRVRG
jgi:membrane protein DedA with SNARE-associated domain